jgi:ATP-dependent Clp protease ATP-binding subunit ClpA
MFERFTVQAREGVVRAQAEARLLRHHYIGTEHILLGLAHDDESVAAAVLSRIGADLAWLRERVRAIVGEGVPGAFDPDDAEALRSIGIDLDEVRRRMEERFGPGALDRPRRRRSGWWRRKWCEPGTSGHIPFTPRAKKALELSLREALRLGHSYIGTEHVLLGLIREGEGIAASLLREAHRGDLLRLRWMVVEELRRRPGHGDRPA